MGLSWLKVVVPQIDVEGIARRSLLTPQLARGEAHQVNVLRLVTPAQSRAVREGLHAADPLDHASLAASIAGKAGMAYRIDIPSAHPLARLKARWRVDVIH